MGPNASLLLIGGEGLGPTPGLLQLLLLRLATLLGLVALDAQSTNHQAACQGGASRGAFLTGEQVV